MKYYNSKMSIYRQNNKVLFAASSNGSGQSRPIYERMICCLEDLGYEVLPSWVINLVRANYKNSEHKPRQVLEEQQNLVREADLMVVECTTPSFGIGFLIT